MIKSSNYTKNNIKFYTNKKNINPHVTTFNTTHKLTKKENTHLHENKINISLNKKNQLYFNKNNNTNFHLSHKNYKKIINNLKNTHQNNYNTYKN